MTLFPGSQSLLGKNVSDMVGDDLKVMEDGSVEGTFHYINDFTEFSSVTEEQSGYYFPFKLTKPGATMTFKKNGTETKKDIPFDSDIIFRVTASDSFEVIVDSKRVVVFTFSKSTFEPEVSKNGRASRKAENSTAANRT